MCIKLKYKHCSILYTHILKLQLHFNINIQPNLKLGYISANNKCQSCRQTNLFKLRFRHPYNFVCFISIRNYLGAYKLMPFLLAAISCTVTIAEAQHMANTDNRLRLKMAFMGNGKGIFFPFSILSFFN